MRVPRRVVLEDDSLIAKRSFLISQHLRWHIVTNNNINVHNIYFTIISVCKNETELLWSPRNIELSKPTTRATLQNDAVFKENDVLIEQKQCRVKVRHSCHNNTISDNGLLLLWEHQKNIWTSHVILWLWTTPQDEQWRKYGAKSCVVIEWWCDGIDRRWKIRVCCFFVPCWSLVWTLLSNENCVTRLHKLVLLCCCRC